MSQDDLFFSVKNLSPEALVLHLARQGVSPMDTQRGLDRMMASISRLEEKEKALTDIKDNPSEALKTYLTCEKNARDLEQQVDEQIHFMEEAWEKLTLAERQFLEDRDEDVAQAFDMSVSPSMKIMSSPSPNQPSWFCKTACVTPTKCPRPVASKKT